MPAKSSRQAKAAGLAIAIKEGKTKAPQSGAKGAASQMAESMSKKQLKDFTKRKGSKK